MISLINESLNSDIHEIGKIEILKTFSFFELDSIVTQKLIAILNETKFNNVKVRLKYLKEDPLLKMLEVEKKKTKK